MIRFVSIQCTLIISMKTEFSMTHNFFTLLVCHVCFLRPFGVQGVYTRRAQCGAGTYWQRFVFIATG